MEQNFTQTCAANAVPVGSERYFGVLIESERCERVVRRRS